MFKFIQLEKGFIHKQLIILLMIGALYSLGIFLSNTFVNVYLWRQTNDFFTITTYNLSMVISQMITFILAGKLAKKIDRIIVLRLGVIFLAIFFITVLSLGEHAAVYNILLGCLLGIGYGFYWLAFSVLIFEITEPETRDIFNGFMGGLESFAGMVGPLLAGFIIAKLTNATGYMIIFTISLVMFIVAVICSFFLERRPVNKAFDLISPLKELKINLNWKYVVLANFAQGMREGVFMFVISILVFIVTDNEFKLGIFNFVLCFSSLLFYIVVTKYLKQAKRKIALFIGSTVISLAVFVFAFNFNYKSMLIYAIIVGIAYPILNVPFNSVSLDVIGRMKHIDNLRIEFIVLLEFFSNLGRTSSLILFIFCLIFTSNITIILILLIIISQAYLLIYFFMRKITIIQRETNLND